MGKSIHFFGQPVFRKLVKLLDLNKIIEMSRSLVGNAM